MREAYFRKTRQESWDSIDAVNTNNPDDLANSFLEVTQDLSFAKTFFSHSDLVPYLNKLSGNFYSKLYKNKKNYRGAFKKFWLLDLPLIVYKHRKQLLYSFLFFLLTCIIGAVAAAKNPDFIKLVLGPEYINMTNNNIDKGNPFGVYKSIDSVTMFFSIMVNNIYVSFLIFVYGFLFCAGTLWNLFLNGIMLGSFQYYFFSKGLGWASVLVIWIHGTLEISAIIISGAAGLILGKGLIFPGTYSRLSSLTSAALDGVKIMVGLVPVFITAAWLESFITRKDHMPKIISVSILLSSLFLILFYFYFYPRILTKKSSTLQL